jgi:hypothetical protein
LPAVAVMGTGSIASRLPATGCRTYVFFIHWQDAEISAAAERADTRSMKKSPCLTVPGTTLTLYPELGRAIFGWAATTCETNAPTARQRVTMGDIVELIARCMVSMFAGLCAKPSARGAFERGADIPGRNMGGGPARAGPIKMSF